MADTRNIVVLGASQGGISAAHYIVRHTLPQLARSKDAKYILHLVDESTHFWWHHGAPRELVSVKAMPHDKYFVPIMDGFKQYTNHKDSIVFHHGSATGVDLEARTVTFKAHGGESSEAIPYYSLVIATGIRSPTPATTLHGDHKISLKALEDMNTKLASASEVIIGGGGPIAVETAGEVGAHLKGKARITLIASGEKLLPSLRKSLSDKAQAQLAKVGVTVLYKTKVVDHHDNGEGKTEVQLSNGKSMVADVYIPAVGVVPNTTFLPQTILKEGGWVNTNPTTLRVDSAGPRVYSVGDVANVDKGGTLLLFSAIPVFGANFTHDILKDAGVSSSVAERSYKRNDGETQLVPVGPKTGVGAFNGWSMPAFVVSMVKGKDYMVKELPGIHQGTKFAKA